MSRVFIWLFTGASSCEFSVRSLNVFASAAFTASPISSLSGASVSVHQTSQKARCDILFQGQHLTNTILFSLGESEGGSA
mmetsp:Transcript_8328/g.23224  ORF Transcript_8328/g.23224 Transcript_8328/m.23224 type:complete len:80 (+) Transcript_8328:126-365(+)